MGGVVFYSVFLGRVLILGFALFRFFDIVKPWPIRLIDRRLGGGLGIMLDDLLAGIFANAVLWLLLPYRKTAGVKPLDKQP